MTEQHDMVLEETKPTGEENWYCPTCGRRMIITWRPWKKEVIAQGNVFAAHSGSKGGLRMGSVQTTQGGHVISSTAVGPAADDPSLAPWQRWLNRVDTDDL